MFRSTGSRARSAGVIIALALAASLSGHEASAQMSAQICVEDQYGRVVCGRPVNPNRADPSRDAPRYQNPPPERDYGPPPGRESAVPPPRDRAPPHRDYGPPPERDYGPPPGRESAAPPARDFTPPPRRDYRPPNERDYGPPPAREREYVPPPPAERDQGGDPREFGRLYPDNGPRFQRPMRGPNGELVCARDFAVQDGLCKPYIRR